MAAQSKMANINISQIRMKRGNTAAASTYVGPLGELVVDTGLRTIRVQDGVTPGGMSTLATNVQLQALGTYANAAGTYGNANVANYLNNGINTSSNINAYITSSQFIVYRSGQSNYSAYGPASLSLWDTYSNGSEVRLNNVSNIGYLSTLDSTNNTAGQLGITNSSLTYSTGYNSGGIPLTTAFTITSTGNVQATNYQFANGVNILSTVSAGPGNDGAPGQDGSKWLTGSGLAPAPGTNPGDQYLDADTGNVYQWDGETWILSGNIKGPQGDSGSGSSGTVWTNDANGCLRAELSATGFQAFTDATHLDLQDSGQWTIGSYQYGTFIGNDEFTNVNILSLRSGDDTYITTNLRENGNHQWKFGTDGTLTIPGGIEFTSSTATIANVDTITVLDHIRSPAYQFANGVSILNGLATIVGNVGGDAAMGALWFNTEDSRTYVRAGGYWVDANPPVAPAPSFYTGNLEFSGDTIISDTKAWTFGTDGNITLPAGGNLITSTGGLHSISLDLLKSIVASSSTWGEFQANIAAL